MPDRSVVVMQITATGMACFSDVDPLAATAPAGALVAAQVHT